MTNHNVFTPKDIPLTAAAAAAAVAASANATPHYSYPPPRSVGGAADYAGFKKLLTQLEHRSNGGGGGGSGWNGPWLDSMRASSPTHVASAAAVLTSPSLTAPCTAEYEEWMVCVTSNVAQFFFFYQI